MWKIIILLWSVPFALGVLMLARLAEGSPPLNDKESRLLFGDTKEMTLSPWLALTFVALAVVFFIIGFFEELILVNIGSLPLVVVSLMTGLAAILLLARCLRSESRKNRIAARNSAPSPARDSHSAGIVSVSFQPGQRYSTPLSLLRLETAKNCAFARVRAATSSLRAYLHRRVVTKSNSR